MAISDLSVRVPLWLGGQAMVAMFLDGEATCVVSSAVGSLNRPYRVIEGLRQFQPGVAGLEQAAQSVGVLVGIAVAH